MLGRIGRLMAFGLVICLLLLSGMGLSVNAAAEIPLKTLSAAAVTAAPAVRVNAEQNLPANTAAGSLHTEVSNPSLEASVELGYDGRVTYGKAFPVRVTIRNSGEDLEGVLAVNAYVSTQKYDRFETEISVPAGGERTYVLPVTAEIQQNVFTAEILCSGEVILAVNAEPDSVINPSAMMIGVLSTRPRNLSSLDISQENDTLMRYEYWQTVALTPETLPDDPELLGAFGMIVLDDTDPALLTEKQQNALKDWIRQGHVLLCGGGSTAPRNLAFLGDLTGGLRAEEFTVSSEVYTALESYADRKATSSRPEVAVARMTGEDPLVSDKDGSGLIWRIPAGAGRVYVLAWEAGDAALNAESLMHIFYQQMLIKADPSLYNNILYSQGSDYSAYYSPGGTSPVPVKNTLPLAAIILGAVMLAGAAAWIVLQRKGLAKWMWLAVPVLALGAAAAVALMAGSSPLNRPVASAAVNLVQDASGELTRYTSVTAAAPRAGLHRYALEGEDLDVQIYDDYYYWYDDEEEAKQPVTLRAVRTSGGNREVAVNAASSWDEAELRSVGAEETAGSVDAAIWMEQDGFHGTVTNNTAWALKEGVVVCVYGFVRVPALQPGESADFVLLQAEAKDPLNPVYEDGKMFLNAVSGLYTVVYSVWNKPGEEMDYDSRESALSGMMNAASDQLTQSRSRSGSTQENAVFFYSAEPEGVELPALSADGEAVESVAVLPLLTAEVSYETVGRTGVVFHTPGMDKPVRCVLDSGGFPMGDMETGSSNAKYSYNYYALTERPTFRFSPEGLKDMEVTSLIIGMERWYLSDCKCYVLNVKQKTWVEFQPNTPLQLPSQYIDSEGNIYCQFRSATGETYAEIPAPTLTLEGRVKNAEP